MAINATTAQPSPFAVFRNKSFTLMWIGQFVSTVGTALTSLAAAILVFRLTGSAMSVGLMLMATAVPSLAVGLIAGVFVDRYDRKKIMVICELVRAVLVAMIPLLIKQNIAWLYIIVMLTSAIGQFYDPAHESVLPDIAPEKELAAANSLISIASFGSTAIGFAASGLIASAYSIDWAFYFDAITFLFSALCIALLTVPKMTQTEESSVSAIFKNLKSGAETLFKNDVLRSMFIVSAVIFVSFGMWNTLLLPFSMRALGATEFEYGLQEGLTSVGFVIGSLLMARLANRLPETQWVVLGLTGMAVVGILYGLSSNIPLAIFLVMLSGFLNSPESVSRRLILQRNTPREMRGRVYSAFFVARDLVFLIGMSIAGLADVINIRVLVVAASLLLVVAAGLFLWMPALAQPAAVWRRSLSLLRGAQAAPGLAAGRIATLADLDQLAVHLPALAGISLKDRRELAANATVTDAPAGTTIIRKGDASTAAFFLLSGRAVAGQQEGNDFRLLEVLNDGDFFGEIAALTGVPRTANVVAEQPSSLLLVPAEQLRKLMNDAQLNRVFLSKMTERMMRLSMVDLPRLSSMDQGILRELRSEATASPEPDLQPA